MPSRRSVLLVAAAWVAVPTILRAQEPATRDARNEAGVALEYAQPVGQFRQNVKQGFGAGAHYTLNLDSQGIVGIRISGDFINYGNETQYLPFSELIGAVTLQEQTSNNIVMAMIGPQLSVPVGRARAYVAAGVGFGYLYTQTSVSGTDGEPTLAQTTNYSDYSAASSVEGGFTLPIMSEVGSDGRATGARFHIDLGVRYNAIGRVRYLTRGDITDDPNSLTGLTITPRESEARFWAYRLGVGMKF